jgi:hypothetical protein
MKMELIQSLSDIDRQAWDSLANPDPARANPFIRYDFLRALEVSGCVGEETGWWPHHLVAHNEEGTLQGAMPGYLKSHSQGEYVFDHAWADAFGRAGGRYYPKWVSAAPFTPAPGPRVLAANGEIATMMLRAAMTLPQQLAISSAHILFMDSYLIRAAKEMGWLLREDIQFHWQDEDYGDFEGFLAALSSRKRKDLRKERRRAQDGLDFVWKRGADISNDDLDAFFDFYQDTGARKWGQPYLNREFFEEVHARMGDDMLLILALENDLPIAGALNFIGGETLFGRYWGRIEERPFLHFETCYYQAIDFALAHGLKRVEAGAQGGHKLARGYAPVITRSLHAIAHEGLRAAVEDYLEQERRAVNRESVAMAEVLPFRK